jgi:DNA-binding NarL/FixJ family response regulator
MTARTKMAGMPALMALSKRQGEVLQAACDGKPDKFIAG